MICTDWYLESSCINDGGLGVDYVHPCSVLTSSLCYRQVLYNGIEISGTSLTGTLSLKHPMSISNHAIENASSAI